MKKTLITVLLAVLAGCGGGDPAVNDLYHGGEYGEEAHFDSPRIRTPESIDYSCHECHFNDAGQYEPHTPWLHGFADHWQWADDERTVRTCRNCHAAAGYLCHDCH